MRVDNLSYDAIETNDGWVRHTGLVVLNPFPHPATAQLRKGEHFHRTVQLRDIIGHSSLVSADADPERSERLIVVNIELFRLRHGSQDVHIADLPLNAGLLWQG